MQQQYITLITALTSVALGSALTLLGAHFTNRSAEKRLERQLQHEATQRKQELLRARGEELYTITSEWLKVIGTYQLRSMAVLHGNITYNQALDQQIADGKPSYNFDRIEMLMDTYFPTAKPAYKALLAERDNFNELHFAFKHKYKQVGASASDKQTVCSHEKSVKMMENLGNALKDEIVQSLRSIGSEEGSS